MTTRNSRFRPAHSSAGVFGIRKLWREGSPKLKEPTEGRRRTTPSLSIAGEPVALSARLMAAAAVCLGMACTVFTIANQKGGVGKTTTAVNLAAALAEKKIHTLLVDLDPQANATSALGVEKQEGKSLYRPLHGDGTALGMITATPYEHLALIPSEVDLAAAEIEL